MQNICQRGMMTQGSFALHDCYMTQKGLPKYACGKVKRTVKALMAFWRLSASPTDVPMWFHSLLRGRGMWADCLLFTGGSPVDTPRLVVSVPPAQSPPISIVTCQQHSAVHSQQLSPLSNVSSMQRRRVGNCQHWQHRAGMCIELMLS